MAVGVGRVEDQGISISLTGGVTRRESYIQYKQVGFHCEIFFP